MSKGKGDPPKKDDKKDKKPAPQQNTLSASIHDTTDTRRGKGKGKGKVNKAMEGRVHPRHGKDAMSLHRGDAHEGLAHPEEMTFSEMFTKKFQDKLS